MKRFQTTIWLFLALIFLFVLSACSPDRLPEVDRDNGDALSTDEKIVLKGFGVEQINILISEIRKLPPVERDVVLIRKSGEEKNFRVKGALLADLLESLGKDQKNLSGIRFIAGDGYMIEVGAEILANRDIIMAYEIDDQPLEEGVKPIRIVIPEERGMYWVKNLIQIEILAAREVLPLSKLIILDTAVQNLARHEYEYHGSMDKAVAAADLFKDEVPMGQLDTVYIKATDGLEKNEKTKLFNTGFIKFTGANSPAFVSPDIPRGMHVKDILWLSKGDTGYLSLKSAFGYFPKQKVENLEGIRLSDLFVEVAMAEGKAYLFTTIDGDKVEINQADIAKGILYFMADGVVALHFEGLPGNNFSVKRLGSIKAGN